jgi:hypothetical protein
LNSQGPVAGANCDLLRTCAANSSSRFRMNESRTVKVDDLEIEYELADFTRGSGG